MSRKPRILLALPTFMPHDAVGNDVYGMYRCFREAGYDAAVYAQYIHQRHEAHTLRADLAPRETWENPSDILIYHHAIEWALGERILAGARCKVVIKHHNVTPPDFFEAYARHYYETCRRGMETTARLAVHPTAVVWGDSAYNAADFVSRGVAPERCRVLAPFHHTEELAGAPLDTPVIGTYRQNRVNILFVGGFRPNKGHLKALDVAAAYRDLSGVEPKLLFAGSADPALSQYVDDLHSHAAFLGMDQSLHVALGVTPSQLRAYYYIASVFLCVSEHEGFCVPVVESMYFRTPVVAWANTAVGETCGDAALAFDRYDARTLAEAIDECVENPALARDLAARGRRRYESVFSPAAIRRRLLELAAEVERE